MTYIVYVDPTHQSMWQDTVNIVIAKRMDNNADTVRVAEPIVITYGREFPAEATGAEAEVHPTVLPRELAEKLLNVLAHVLLGTDGSDVVATITRMRRELATSERRVDALIAGIGRTGGVGDRQG